MRWRASVSCSPATALMIVLAIVIMNVGISATKAPLWAMPIKFLSGAGAAAGVATIDPVGNPGGFDGPFTIGWLKNVTGGYAAGLYVVGATLAVSAVVTLMLRSTDKACAGCGERAPRALSGALGRDGRRLPHRRPASNHPSPGYLNPCTDTFLPSKVSCTPCTQFDAQS